MVKNGQGMRYLPENKDSMEATPTFVLFYSKSVVTGEKINIPCRRKPSKSLSHLDNVLPQKTDTSPRDQLLLRPGEWQNSVSVRPG